MSFGKKRKKSRGQVRLQERISYENNWLKHVKFDGTGCMLWTASLDGRGYGTLRRGGTRKYIKAHRWMFEKFRHPINPNKELNHLCNKPNCVNPWHLEEVTHGENQRYAYACGRRKPYAGRSK